MSPRYFRWISEVKTRIIQRMIKQWREMFRRHFREILEGAWEGRRRDSE